MTAVSGATRPALFLDRDGVIVDEVNYLHRVEDMRLSEGAAAVIGMANSADIPVVVVTNQSGVGRAMFGWSDFEAVQQAMIDALAAEGAHVNAVFACPFHGDARSPWDVAEHRDRKPQPGMLVRAAGILPIELAASWIVGDRAGDLGAGKNAGLAGGMHVLSGHGDNAGERAAALRHGDDDFRVIAGTGIGDFPGATPLLR